MAFLGSIGKFVSGVVGQAAKALPAVVSGFATGGPAGAARGLVTSQLAPGGFPSQIGGAQNLFGGVQSITSSFLPNVSSFPLNVGQQSMPQAIPVADTQLQLTKPIFDIIVKLADRLNIPLKRVSSVVRIGRSIVSKLLRASKAIPGMNIVTLLLSLGLAEFEANQLLTWYATSGKKRRRIKVTNVKALNRSVRRLEGFRRLSRRVDMALAGRVSSRGLAVRRRRCPRCRKNPCCC